MGNVQLENYANELKRFLTALTQNPHVAEDIVQETFLKAYLHIDQYQGKCSIKSWLFQIARNCYLDWLRKEKHYVGYDENIDFIETKENPETVFFQSERTRFLLKEIYQLKVPANEVFLLRSLGEMSFKEIGEIYQRNENWARVTYYRARLQLMERVREIENQL